MTAHQVKQKPWSVTIIINNEQVTAHQVKQQRWSVTIIINNEQVTAHQVKQTHMERYNDSKQRTSDSTSSETNTHGALQ